MLCMTACRVTTSLAQRSSRHAEHDVLSAIGDGLARGESRALSLTRGDESRGLTAWNHDPARIAGRREPALRHSAFRNPGNFPIWQSSLIRTPLRSYLLQGTYRSPASPAQERTMFQNSLTRRTFVTGMLYAGTGTVWQRQTAPGRIAGAGRHRALSGLRRHR
jgi:hypothetical protein